MVDFNPYSPMTDALLFTWEELSSIALGRLDGGSKGLPILRIVNGERSIQPSDLQSFRLPKVGNRTSLVSRAFLVRKDLVPD